MRSKRRIGLLVIIGIAVLALPACGGSSSTGSAPDPSGEGVRTIEINALDTLRFEPEQVSIKVGDSVRFVVTNTGATIHEFIVGDEDVQMSHEEEMGSGGSMAHDGTDMPALTLAPGETMEAVVTFDEPGTLMFGCHQPGHYDGGMVGTITVTS